MNPPLTPQHDKILSFGPSTAAISEFLEHLENEGLEIAKFDNDGSRDYETFTPEELIGAYLGIDMAAFKAEKEALLAYVRYTAQLVGNAAKLTGIKIGEA